MTIVDRIPDDKDKVYFGALVSLEDPDGKEFQYRIVGPDEFDIRQNKLSMDSPLARTILGKRLDDEFVFQSPEGEKHYTIVDIQYQSIEG